jgi:hypothetical protein
VVSGSATTCALAGRRRHHNALAVVSGSATTCALAGRRRRRRRRHRHPRCRVASIVAVAWQHRHARGGLMDLLNAMAARRVAGPGGCSPEDVAIPDDVIIQGHGPFEPTVLGEDGAHMQIDLPVHDLVEAPHHADSYEGLNTPKKDPISSTSVSNFSSCSNLFIIHKCHKLHNLILILYLYFSLQSSWFVPCCKDERLKPAVGMLFDTLDEVEEFYKTCT